MSSDVNQINIGAQANDGTGSSIRDAFAIVNTNFANIDLRLTTGNIAAISASGRITAHDIVSNTSVTAASLSVTKNANISGDLSTHNILNSGAITSAGAITSPAFHGNFYGDLHGVAASATVLANVRRINGIPFDGSTDITVSDTAVESLTGRTIPASILYSSLTQVGVLDTLTVANTILGSITGSASTVTNPVQNNITSVGTLSALTVAGTLMVGGLITGSLSGNAASATKLAVARNINGVPFDGTASVTVTASASTLTGGTLSANVTASSLTTVGVLNSVVVAGGAYASRFVGPVTGVIGDVAAAAGTFTALNAATAAISGDTIINGNLTVNGATTTVNSNTVATVDKNIVIASGANNNAQADGAGITVNGSGATIMYSASTNSWDLNKPLSATLRTTAQPAITSLGQLIKLDVTGDVTATGFYGIVHGGLIGVASSASKLDVARNINGVSFNGTADITVPVNANALTGSQLANNITASSLTSVGTLNSLNVSSTVTANSFVGAFSGLGTNLTGVARSLSIGGSSATAASANIVTDAAQPAITSVGVLTNLTVSGVITGTLNGALNGNAATATRLSNPRTINGVPFDGTAPITVAAEAATLIGTSLNNSITYSSLTSVGTLGSLTVTGGVTATTFTGQFIGDASKLTGTVPSMSIGGNAATATLANNALSANNAVVVTAAAQPAITSVGTLGSLAVTGGVTANTFTGQFIGDASKLTGTVPSLSIGGNAATATVAASAAVLQTPRYINGVSFNGSADINVPGIANSLTGNTIPTNVTTSSLTTVGTLLNLTVAGSTTSGVFNGALNGNATTATKLLVQRNINGIPFDGATDVTVPADASTLTGTTLSPTVTASSLTSVGTLGTLTVAGGVSASIFAGPLNGTAATATKLATPRTINGVPFDGGADITVSVASTSLTGSVLPSNIVTSSLTTVGALQNLTVTGTIYGTVAGAAFTRSSAPPTTATSGDEWYNSFTNVLYKYMNGAWVSIYSQIPTLDGGSF